MFHQGTQDICFVEPGGTRVLRSVVLVKSGEGGTGRIQSRRTLLATTAVWPTYLLPSRPVCDGGPSRRHLRLEDTECRSLRHSHGDVGVWMKAVGIGGRDCRGRTTYRMNWGKNLGWRSSFVRKWKDVFERRTVHDVRSRASMTMGQ